jgi:predicted Abi (CAAX) family protease
MQAGAIIARLRRAIAAKPSVRDGFEFAVAAAGFALAAGLAGGGLLHWSPRSGAQIAGIAAIAFLIPALGEETVFRGLLVPDRGEAIAAFGPIVASTLLFIAWHGAETLWLPGARAIFLRADFLMLAGLLGLACAILRRRSGSIWTAVLLHWSAATVWIGFFGGPDLQDLR